MRCKHCGTEIAEKALICYRCGVAAEELPTPAPEPIKQSHQSPLLVWLALTVLVLAALFMGQIATGEVPRMLSWSVAALAALVALWRLVAGR